MEKQLLSMVRIIAAQTDLPAAISHLLTFATQLLSADRYVAGCGGSPVAATNNRLRSDSE